MISILLLIFPLTSGAVPTIDTMGLEQYKRAHFESHETGWFGLNAEWAQRIYIGQSEDDTKLWFTQMQSQYYKQKVEPMEGDWDEGMGNDEFIMIRMQTLGLLCQGKNASMCIDQLQSRIVDVESFCPAPQITKNDDLWTVQLLDTDSDCQIMFTGGEPIYENESLQFTKLPTAITIYNQYVMSWKYILQEVNSYQLQPQSTDQPHRKLPQ